jgi:hypothetical protein
MLIAVSQMDSLIEELERSYADAQERMSDPAIFSDRQAAEAGRSLKELEGPHKLAQEWRSTHDDLEAAREDSSFAGSSRARARPRELEDELKIALVERTPTTRRTSSSRSARARAATRRRSGRAISSGC